MNRALLRLGTFEVPEMRLYPTAVSDANKLIESRVVEIDYKDLAKVWKYAKPNTGSFYRRLNTLLAYGLLEPAGSRGRFRVSQLAKDLYHPMNDEHRKNLYKQAVMNIPLWKELHTRVGKNPPESIYVHLKNITGAEPAEIEKLEREVRKWYFEDISLVPEEILPKHYSANIVENVEISDSVSASVQKSASIQSSVEATIEIPFGGKYAVKYPAAMHPRQALEQITKYMKLHIQDYESEHGESDIVQTD